MKLLFDENLSPKLCRMLEDLEVKLSHVSTLKLNETPDQTIWKYARRTGHMIVTRDRDFIELANRFGAPPKVFVILLPNPTSVAIANVIRDNFKQLKLYYEAANDTVLIIQSS